METTLVKLCEKAFTKFSSRLAIEYFGLNHPYSREISRRWMTYCELKRVSDELSNFLTSMQIAEGALCGIFMDSCLEYPVCVLGILGANFAYMPLDTSIKRERLLEKIQATGTEVLIEPVGSHTLDGLLQDLRIESSVFKVEFRQDCIELKLHKILTSSLQPRKVERNDVAYVMCTSGTTGKPKIITVSHGCIIPNIVHISNIFHINENSKVAMSSPPTFDPSVVEMFITFSCGAALVTPSSNVKINPTLLCDVWFRRARITCLQATPSLMKRFSVTDLKEKIFSHLSSLKVMAFGGESCPSYHMIKSWIMEDGLEKIIETISFFNLYGITEVSSWATCHRLNATCIRTGSNSSVPIGEPLMGTTIELINELDDMSLCTVSGPAVPGGPVEYDISDRLKKMTKLCENAKLYIGGKRCCNTDGQDEGCKFSGDIVTFRSLEEGEYHIHFCGRVDSVVKRNGKSLNLEEISDKIELLPDVQSCTAIYTVNSPNNSANTTEMVIAFVVRNFKEYGETTRNEVEIITSAESKRWTFQCFRLVSEVLQSDSIPDLFVEINKLPVTPHGKVDRRKLTDVFERYKSDHFCKKDICKETLVEVLQTILPTCLNKIEIYEKDLFEGQKWLDKTFLQLSGNSIQAVTLISWLEMFLDISVPQEALACIFTKTLRHFLNRVVQATRSKKPAINLNPSERGTKRKKLHHTPNDSKGTFETRSSTSNNAEAKQVLCSSCPSLQVVEQWRYNTGKCVDASPLVVKSGNSATCYAPTVTSFQQLILLMDLYCGSWIYQTV